MNHGGLLLETGRNILAGIDQTNANWSHFTRKGKGSGRTELPLFGESGGAVFFENRPAVKVTFPIEIGRGRRSGRRQSSADFASVGTAVLSVINSLGTALSSMDAPVIASGFDD
jgi:hypothetical protein